MTRNPNDKNAVYWLVTHYRRNKQYDKGLEVLNSFMTRNPSDKNAVAMKNQLQQLMNIAKPDSTVLDSAKSDSVSN